MVLYTPLSEVDIFPADQTAYDNTVITNYNQTPIKALKLENGSYQIIQVLSTDPSIYLHPDYQPGMQFNA
ncbi:YlzJ-like protein [Thalassobacillus cyri]|uniref:YlzJ-like protein n=1 Tax=Thalassobacillus cyri TaxID=571932 RepID=A0A1H4G025_9BACI|nr:YlzJ-like family protein [Thalassobacillus cyri]SEB02410.1 YlzJ-like protein [Thalassobacillus cyri]